jgi:hypothetical protein
MFDLNANISAWMSHIQAKLKLTPSQKEELQNQLNASIQSLSQTGLTPEEAFLIAVKRVITEQGYITIVDSESEVWKQVQIKAPETKADTNRFRSILLVIVFSAIAGTLSKIPEWFFRPVDGWSLAYEMLIFKNITLWVLPLVALYLLIRHKSGRKMILTLMGIFVLSFILINGYPFGGERQTELLSGLHVPLLLWLITGVAYLGDEWKVSKRRMDFIRFTGEAFIYGVLIFCGLGVLSLFIFLIFSSINVDPSDFVTKILLPYGSYATVLVSIYQVEKKNLMENFAPILAKIFSPLFLIAMVVFLLTIVITGRNPLIDRNYLIAFDAMLILVLALVVYILSARKEGEPVNLFDVLSLTLIVTALIIDGIALFEIVSRLFTMGITPNKMAALGENLLVMGNLGGLAYFYLQVMRKKGSFEALEKYQTDYLWFYAGWLAIVAFVFPLLFGFM